MRPRELEHFCATLGPRWSVSRGLLSSVHPGGLGGGRSATRDRFSVVALLVYTVVGMIGFLIGYAVGLGGTVSSLIFLTILTIGLVHRAAEPILTFLRG